MLTMSIALSSLPYTFSWLNAEALQEIFICTCKNISTETVSRATLIFPCRISTLDNKWTLRQGALNHDWCTWPEFKIETSRFSLQIIGMSDDGFPSLLPTNVHVWLPVCSLATLANVICWNIAMPHHPPIFPDSWTCSSNSAKGGILVRVM